MYRNGSLLSKDYLKLRPGEVWIFITKSWRILYEYPYPKFLDAVRFASSRLSWNMKLLKFKKREVQMIRDGVLADQVDHISSDGRVHIKQISFDIGENVKHHNECQYDWICEECGNDNWARRSNCHLCFAPRIHQL